MFETVFWLVFFGVSLCVQARGTKIASQLAQQWDNVTDKQIQEGKAMGVKLDRKRKAWVVTSEHGDQDVHRFGVKHGSNSEDALREAISRANFLSECEARVFDWTKKQCSSYTREHNIHNGQARSSIASHRGVVASHMWQAGKPSTSSNSKGEGAAVSPPETGVSAQTSDSKGGKTCPTKQTGSTDKNKETAMFGLPSATIPGNCQSAKDVTSIVFRSGKEKEAVQSIVEAETKNDQEICTVNMPKVTLVKFLEGVALVEKNMATQVFGDLIGSQILKGKYKGCWSVGGLFIPDITAPAEKNEEERRQWLAANPTLFIIGRQGLVYMPSMCRCYIYIWIYTYV